MKKLSTIMTILGILCVAQITTAQDAPPLPFHAAEGCGGIFATHSAYLVNSGTEDNPLGLPSFGGIYVHFGHGRSLTSLTVTETLFGRLELGYGMMYFDMGDLPDDIEDAMGFELGDDAVTMHNYNARLMLIKEGDFGQKWMPAITFGAHYKDNATVEDVDDDTSGTLTAIGIEENAGVDYTLYASKMITALPVPMIVNVGARSSDAAHIGLLGFTGERNITVEGSICAFVMPKLIMALEYRQKQNEYTGASPLIEEEEDWMSLCAGYIINSHMTAAVGYARFGDVLNHEANDSFGIALKYEL
ncbi:DUF3034 family protein [Verrucomicrobiota bacterium]